MKAAMILLTLTLAGCGIDGAPLRPGTNQPVEVKPGLSIGGTAEFGIQSN